MIEPKRILAWIEAATVTGPAKNLLDLCMQATALNPQLHFVLSTFRRKGAPGEDAFLSAAKDKNIPVTVIHETGPWDWSTLAAIRRCAAEVQPAIVQTHGNKSHLLLCASGVTKRLPWIAFHHGYTQPTRKQQLYNLADRYSLRRASLVVTVTDSFRPELLRAGVRPERIRVVPNAVDTQYFEGVWKPRSHAGRIPVIVCTGRLSREKGHIGLLDAVAQLRRQGQKSRVVIVGSGPEQEALQNTAREWDVDLQLPGQTQDVRPFLAEADVFVLPSHSEGSPNSLLEAMAAGMPVVATSVGGVPWTLATGTEGTLVPPHAPAALAAAIQHTLSDEVRSAAMGANARLRVQRDFSVPARLAKLAAIYAEVGRWQVESGTETPSVWR